MDIEQDFTKGFSLEHLMHTTKKRNPTMVRKIASSSIHFGAQILGGLNPFFFSAASRLQ